MVTALDLKAIEDEFLNQCGSCDVGLLTSCTCSQRDYRPTMLALVREVERLRTAMTDSADGLEDRADYCGGAWDSQAMRSYADRLRAAVNS